MGGKGSNSRPAGSNYVFDPAVFGEGYKPPSALAKVRTNSEVTNAERIIASEFRGVMPNYMNPTLIFPGQPPAAERDFGSLLPDRASRDAAENPREKVENPEDRNDIGALRRYYRSLLLDEDLLGDGEGSASGGLGLGSMGDIGVGGTSGLA